MRGNILIASPNLLFDSFFSKTIILLVDETKDGYTGFILNKPLKIKIKEIESLEIYKGGPVSNDNLYFIYKTKSPIKGSLKISDNVYWGGNIDEVFKIAGNEELYQAEKKYLSEKRNYNAVVIAASKGEQLQHLTKNKPKCMLDIHGKPLLERLTSILKKDNIGKITVIRH